MKFVPTKDATRSKQISVRFTPIEMALIEACAEQAGLPRPDFVRQAVMFAIDQMGPLPTFGIATEEKSDV